MLNYLKHFALQKTETSEKDEAMNSCFNPFLRLSHNKIDNLYIKKKDNQNTQKDKHTAYSIWNKFLSQMTI